MHRVVIVTLLSAAFAIPAYAGRHVVQSGESLWTISRKYGCGVEDLRSANKLYDNKLLPGDELRVPSCEKKSVFAGKKPTPKTGLITYAVQSGDTLGKIARRFGTDVNHLRFANNIDGSLIKAGQVLRVTPGMKGPKVRPIAQPLLGQSIGRPQSGRLAKATRLPRSNAYYRRRLPRTYGTNYTVNHVVRVTQQVRSRYPRVHKLAVGDISAKKGGPITEHVSHQTGRDIDLGFYFKRKPKGYPKAFVRARKNNLHFKANWKLLTALAKTNDLDGGVRVMYISYNVQKMLYDLARKNGVSKKELSKMLQYPRGKSALAGMIRHEPGHDDHVHVRFKCPDDDPKCY
ncbi:MAG: penicillin-insensitive murein endopeptidase [Deltaproteobacteria bacterium]|nr:penicillin-insensitive murein endopeptidase [Deltaproteobacteria bacterium]